MYFGLPNLFQSKERRVKKSVNTDKLDRPTWTKGYAHILKQGSKEKQVDSEPVKPVSPHHPNAHTVRMRGIQG